MNVGDRWIELGEHMDRLRWVDGWMDAKGMYGQMNKIDD